MLVIVDDQLAALAALHGLDLPDGFEGPPLSTSRFHLRIAGGLVVDRGGSVGVFGRLVNLMPDIEGAKQVILAPDPDRLLIVDPRELTVGIVKAKSEHKINELAAEVVAAAIHLDAAIRVSPGNSRGQVQRVATELAMDFGIWRSRPVAGGAIGVEDVSLEDADVLRRSRLADRRRSQEKR